MSFVFLSHADADKPRVRYIVDALVAAGLKVWLDNPLAMGFSGREIKEYFQQLDAGFEFRKQIDAGLRGAGAVLVCWSEKAKEDRNVWHSEATVARAMEKLVACRIDDVDPAQLPDGHGTEQIPDLRIDDAPFDGGSGWRKLKRVPRPRSNIDGALTLLVDAVKAKIAESASRRFEQRVQSRSVRDQFAPFLIDRVDQEGSLIQALDGVTETGGIRPALITGPENECPDEFLERLRKYRNRKRLNEQAWYEVKVEWPGRHEPGSFALEYRSRLAVELGLPSTASQDVLAGALAQKGRTVAIVSLMRAQEWQVNEPKRITAWLKWWEELALGPVRVTAIPILSVKMPKVKPAWRHCPGGCAPGGSVRNADIWRAAQRLQHGGGRSLLSMFVRRKPSPAIHVPPVLHPIGMGDVDRWLDEHLELMSSDREVALNARDKLFGDRLAHKYGVALEDFAKAMKPLFGTGN